MNLRKLIIIKNISEQYDNNFNILIKELKNKYTSLDSSEYFIISSNSKGKYFGLTNDFTSNIDDWRIVIFIPQEDLYAIKIPEYITTFNKRYNNKLNRHNLDLIDE